MLIYPSCLNKVSSFQGSNVWAFPSFVFTWRGVPLTMELFIGSHIGVPVAHIVGN